MPRLGGRPRGASSPRAQGGPTASLRSLQRIGRVTVGVSLPRPWVDASGLRLGSPVRLTELSDGTIAIRPEPEGRRLRLLVEAGAERHPEHLFRRLLAGYLAGAGEFTVRQPDGLSEANRAVVRAFARRTMRPEVLSEDASALRLVDVSQEAAIPVQRRIARMGQVVLALLDRAGQTWVEPAAVAEGDWLSQDDEVDRQAWFLERSLAAPAPSLGAEGANPVSVILPLHILVRSLERIADHAVQIAEHGQRWASTAAGDLAERLTAFHGRARTLLADSLEAALAGDIDRSNDLLDTGEALHEEYRALTESLLHRRGPADGPGPSALELAWILPSIDRTVAYAQDIAEAGLDLGVRAELLASPAPSRSSPSDERGGKRNA